MEGRIDVVRAVPTLMHRGVGAHDVVEGQDVAVSQLLDARGVGPNRRGLRWKLRLGIYGTNFHDCGFTRNDSKRDHALIASRNGHVSPGINSVTIGTVALGLTTNDEEIRW